MSTCITMRLDTNAPCRTWLYPTQLYPTSSIEHVFDITVSWPRATEPLDPRGQSRKAQTISTSGYDDHRNARVAQQPRRDAAQEYAARGAVAAGAADQNVGIFWPQIGQGVDDRPA